MHRLPPFTAAEAHTPGGLRALAPRSPAAPAKPGTRLVWAALTAWVLTGCVSTVPTTPGATPSPGLVPDVPPALSRLPQLAAPAPGAPGAKFTVRAALISSQQRAGLVRLLDNTQCRQPHLVGLAPRTSTSNTGGSAPGGSGGSSPAAPSANESLSMAAGEPVTLDWLVVDGARMVCAVRWSFTPQANRHYLVQGVSLGTVCSASLTDVTQPDRPRTPEDLRYRTEAGKTCVPLEQARRVPPGMLEGGQVNGEAVLRPLATDDDLKGLIKP